MKTKDITQIAFMISLMILLGFFPPIPIGLFPVPIVIQNASFMLCGLLLGKKNGTIATLLFLFLVALGFPFLAGGRGGISVFFSITAGYLFAYPVATFLIGWSSEEYLLQKRPIIYSFLVTFLFGAILIDLFGAIGVSMLSDVTLKNSLLANLVFIPGDTLKAILVVILAKRIQISQIKRR